MNGLLSSFVSENNVFICLYTLETEKLQEKNEKFVFAFNQLNYSPLKRSIQKKARQEEELLLNRASGVNYDRKKKCKI